MNDIVAAAVELPDWAKSAINVASPRLGTQAISCSDDSFASMARMLNDAPAVFKPDVYDDFGKWMDGWESKRRRDGGHDWCVVKLGARSTITGFDIDTSHFTGNYAPAASVWGADCENEPGEGDWFEVLSSADLGASAHHFALSDSDKPCRWLRLNMYPDGGIARFRAYGEPVVDLVLGETVELSALKNGGRVLDYNDAHYGDVWAVLAEGRGANMGDGWETRRRRTPGNDWLIVKLAAPGTIEKVEVDTAHFKGNFPDQFSLQGALVEWGTDTSATVQAMFWPEIMGRKKLQADYIHTYTGEDLISNGPVSHVKLNIYPDGGVSRLRIWGKPQ